MDPMALLREFVAIPGPPGQEEAIAAAVRRHVEALGLTGSTDAKGNLVVSLGNADRPKIVITAHLDEIAMIVRSVDPDGRLRVDSLGGLFPWKIGEGPVQVLASEGAIDGVLSFGSIHTADPRSVVRRADNAAIEWSMARVITGRSAEELARAGVRPGTRVVVHPSRRSLLPLGDLISGHFLDDRADLVSWLLALESLRDTGFDVTFAATAAEEVGGEGALFLMQRLRPDVCIALELGPQVLDAPVQLTADPTVWVTDSYSSTSAADVDLVASVGRKLGMNLQFQALSRGGSDASCAASHGHCARPITLGLAMENSHGFEVMHVGAMAELARLTVELVRQIAS